MFNTEYNYIITCEKNPSVYQAFRENTVKAIAAEKGMDSYDLIGQYMLVSTGKTMYIVYQGMAGAPDCFQAPHQVPLGSWNNVIVNFYASL